MKKVTTLIVLSLVSVAFLGGCARRCAEPCEPRCGERYEKVTKEYGCK